MHQQLNKKTWGRKTYRLMGEMVALLCIMYVFSVKIQII